MRTDDRWMIGPIIGMGYRIDSNKLTGPRSDQGLRGDFVIIGPTAQNERKERWKYRSKSSIAFSIGVWRNVRLSFLFTKLSKLVRSPRKSLIFQWLSRPKRSDLLECAGNTQRHHRSAVKTVMSDSADRRATGKHEKHSQVVQRAVKRLQF